VTRGGVVPKIFIEKPNWNAARNSTLVWFESDSVSEIFLNQIF
jgi:hypothetical protein